MSMEETEDVMIHKNQELPEPTIHSLAADIPNGDGVWEDECIPACMGRCKECD